MLFDEPIEYETGASATAKARFDKQAFDKIENEKGRDAKAKAIEKAIKKVVDDEDSEATPFIEQERKEYLKLLTQALESLAMIAAQERYDGQRFSADDLERLQQIEEELNNISENDDKWQFPAEKFAYIQLLLKERKTLESKDSIKVLKKQQQEADRQWLARAREEIQAAKDVYEKVGQAFLGVKEGLQTAFAHLHASQEEDAREAAAFRFEKNRSFTSGTESEKRQAIEVALENINTITEIVTGEKAAYQALLGRERDALNAGAAPLAAQARFDAHNFAVAHNQYAAMTAAIDNIPAIHALGNNAGGFIPGEEAIYNGQLTAARNALGVDPVLIQKLQQVQHEIVVVQQAMSSQPLNPQETSILRQVNTTQPKVASPDRQAIDQRRKY